MAQLVEHFKGKPRTQDSIVEYCNLNKMSFIPTVGELEDLEYQVEHDTKMLSVFKSILAELQKLEYMPELGSNKERKRIADNNDAVRVAIVKLFEDASVSFHMVDKVAKELGGVIGRIVETAGTTGFNKGMEVLMHIAKERFGADFNLKHARDYAEQVINHAKSKEASVSEVLGEPVSEPQGSGEPQKEESRADNQAGGEEVATA